MIQREFEDSGIVLLGLPYGSPDRKDLQDDYFTKDTDFGTVQEVVAYFSHANPLDEKALQEGILTPETHRKLSLTPMGKAVVETETDEGILYRIMFDKAYRYKKLVKRLYDEGLLGASSTPFQKTVEKESDGKITKWHVIELGPTLSAANPDTRESLKEIFKSIGEDDLVEPKVQTEEKPQEIVEKTEAVEPTVGLVDAINQAFAENTPKEDPNATSLAEITAALGHIQTLLAGFAEKQSSIEKSVNDIYSALPSLAGNIAKSFNLNSFERGARTELLEKQVEQSATPSTKPTPKVDLSAFAKFPGVK